MMMENTGTEIIDNIDSFNIKKYFHFGHSDFMGGIRFENANVETMLKLTKCAVND